jgi:hypothetical protein
MPSCDRTEIWCLNADAGLQQLTTRRNADAGLTFFQHSGIPAFTYNCRCLLVFLSTWLFSKKYLNGSAAYCYALHCTILSYPAPYWTTLHPNELPSFFWAPLYPLSYTAPSELCCTPLSCTCILLSYKTHYLATLNPVELWCCLLS